MVFCYATFVKVLNLSKPGTKNPTQRELQNKILSSVYDSYINAGITDSVSTDLLKGEQGLSDDVISEARKIIENGTVKKVAEYFKRCIIDTNLIKTDDVTAKSIVLALLDIIREDTVSYETVIDKVSEKTKKALLSQSQFVLPDFLAGIFLYAVTAVSNKDKQDSVKEVTTQYIKEAAKKNPLDIKVYLSMPSDDEASNGSINKRVKNISSLFPLIEAIHLFNEDFAEADAILGNIKYPIETLDDGLNLDENAIEHIRASFCEKIESLLAVKKMQIKDDITQTFFTTLDEYYNQIACDSDGEVYDYDDLFEEDAYWFDYSDDEDATAAEYDILSWNNKFQVFLDVRQFFKQYINEFAKILEMLNAAGVFGNYLTRLKTEHSKQRIFISGNESRDFYSFYVPNNIHCNFSGSFGEHSIEEPTVQSITDISNQVIITGTGGLGKSMMMVNLLLNAIDNYAKLHLIPVFARLVSVLKVN